MLPTFKEKENIRPVATTIARVLSKARIRFEIIVVDDNSPDGTAAEARKLPERCNARVFVRKKERGLAGAILFGFMKARYEVVGVTDADGQHPPEVLPRMYAEIENGAEYAIGSRHAKGGSFESGLPFHRQLVSIGATALARPLTGFRTKDIVSGFFLTKKKHVLDNTHEYKAVGYKLLLELLVKKPGRSVEVPIEFKERKKGKTKLDSREILAYLRLLAHLYAWRASKAAHAR